MEKSLRNKKLDFPSKLVFSTSSEPVRINVRILRTCGEKRIYHRKPNFLLRRAFSKRFFPMDSEVTGFTNKKYCSISNFLDFSCSGASLVKNNTKHVC